MPGQAEIEAAPIERAEEKEEDVASQPEAISVRPIERPQLSELARFLRQARALLPTAVVGIFLLAFVAFLYFAKPFVMPIVIATLLAFLLKPLLRPLCRLHIPRMIGALLVIAVFFGTLSFAVSRLVQPAAEWAARAPETMVSMQEKFHTLIRRAHRLSRAAAQVEDIAKDPSTEAATPAVQVKDPVLMKTVFTYTRSFAAGLIETVVLIFFMLAPGDLMLEKLIRVLPTLHDKKKAVEIADEVQHSLSMFLLMITSINTVLGTCVGLASWALGLPNPALWGVLAGALNFIPYFGPITGVAVLTVVGIITFDSPWRSVLPALIYLGLHGVESNVVTPMILGRRLTLNPLVIFISLMFWTWLWGIPGALLSIPLVMMLKILCDHFKPLAPIGEFLSG